MRFMFIALIVLISTMHASAQAQTFYVATDGDNSSGDGSLGQPWATIRHATQNVPDGATILVRPGTYLGSSRVDGDFTQGITVRSEVPYQAILRGNNGAALICFTGQGITVEGFEITHDPDNEGNLVIQIQDLLGSVSGSDGGTDPVVSRITLRNNIIHDSTSNDLLKINNGAENILVEGNLFYNQFGEDEHIDINSVMDVTVQDNIFMNSTPQTDTSAFVVIKDSNADGDSILGTRNTILRRNIFLNYQGSPAHGFVRVGEDSTANFEADGVMIENNLMLGNSSTRMRAALTVMGSRDVTFRNNTVVGDLPALTYAARLLALAPNQPNDEVYFYNNVWSDPTGTMGTEQNIGVDVFEADPSQNDTVILDTNLYFNGGASIPADAGQEINIAADSNATVADPLLPGQSGIVLPTWNGSSFDDGSSTIAQAFMSLAEFGEVGSGSPIIDVARSYQSAVDDLFGNERGNIPDLGAIETNPLSEDIVFRDGFEI